MRTTRTHARRLLATALVGSLLGLPGAATAGTRTVEDPDDTGGKLDLVAAGHGHDGKLLEHTLEMQDRWASKLLAPGTATLVFKTGDRYRKLNLDFRDGELFGEICTDRSIEGGSFTNCSADVVLDRPDRRTLRITLGPRLVKKGVTSYRWQAITFLNQGEGGCAELVCTDRLPDDESWVRHRLVG